MQGIMVNRNVLEFLQVFRTPATNVLSFYFFISLLFLLFWIIYRKRKQKRKSRIFAIFARKRPFLSQTKRWFSVIYTYIG